MNNIYEGYDCVSTKPDIDEIFIAHYGVKGMKWHKHLKKLYNNSYFGKKKAAKRRAKYVAGHLVDDYTSGRYGTKINDNLAYTNKGEAGHNATRWNKWKNEYLADRAGHHHDSESHIINSPGYRKYENDLLIRTSDPEALSKEYANKKRSDERRRRKR